MSMLRFLGWICIYTASIGQWFLLKPIVIVASDPEIKLEQYTVIYPPLYWWKYGAVFEQHWVDPFDRCKKPIAAG